ncbi:MAG: hypothetical protein RIS70_1253 [Planctomycetota bacterium]
MRSHQAGLVFIPCPGLVNEAFPVDFNVSCTQFQARFGCFSRRKGDAGVLLDANQDVRLKPGPLATLVDLVAGMPSPYTPDSQPA